MTELNKGKRLKKELGLLDVYAIATGTTLSAGIFLLPGLAAVEAGPALVLAYLLAAVPLIPAMFSVVELATAMPRAGGVYYFLDRSLGPGVGTIGGLGTWIALILKVAFALVGMGAYVGLFIEIPLKPLAIGLALLLGAVNLLGAKKSGKLQVLLVLGLLAILGIFTGGGLPRLESDHFNGFLDAGLATILSTAGFVYISYVGVTKVASLSEEVKDPERNLPLGVFLALGTSIVFYGLITSVIVGVVPMEELKGSLTPVASAAGKIFGDWGVLMVSAAALFAFISVANAGTMSASRYPLAMSRDRLLPRAFRQLNTRRTPVSGILATVGVIVLVLLFLDATKIAKLASAFQLLMFALVCLAVIVMRESKIEAYDPGYRSPFYPWLHLMGIGLPFIFIWMMGPLPSLFTLALVTIGGVWYGLYGRSRVNRSGAIFHFFARLGEKGMDSGLEQELRHIMREKGLREEDPFDQVVANALVIELEEGDKATFEDLAADVAEHLSKPLPATAEELTHGFLEATRIGATPVSKGVSLPHLRLFGIDQPEMVLVRSRDGIHVDVTDVHGEHSPSEPIFSLFFLVSPEEDPRQHLRILAQLAERVDDERFLDDWRESKTEQELKEILLRDDRFLSLTLRPGEKTNHFIGKLLRDLPIPESALVALVHRRGQIVVPRGSTQLREGDRLTILGEPAEIRHLRSELVD